MINEAVCDAFEQYCCDLNYDKIKEYLENYNNLSNYNNGEYFEIIADKGNLNLIKLFIDHGAKIDIDKNYVLFTCGYHKFFDCVDYLLSIGADVEQIKYTCAYKNIIDYLKTI